MADETVLIISPIGVPPYSARGIVEELSLISGAVNLRRTINGELLNFSASQFNKYKLSWSCDDMDSPALNVVPGEVVTVSCITELSYLTVGGSPARPVVSGSSRVSGDFTFYRPVLTIRLGEFQVMTDEWGKDVSWRRDGEEI